MMENEENFQELTTKLSPISVYFIKLFTIVSSLTAETKVQDPQNYLLLLS